MDEKVAEYIDANGKRYLEELVEWLKIPSISALPEHGEDVRQAALWAKRRLQEIGLPRVELIEGEGHPLVYGEWLVDSGQPTVLIYGHYDVQPVDPIDDWDSPPFEPEIRNGSIYARGASDDKGQVMIVLAALEAWSKASGAPPVNCKILLEGEEESGGAFVDRYVRTHAEMLKADAALICDTHMNSVDQPSIIIGLRGIVYAEIRVTGARSDLHSGSYGGAAPNPLHALCLLLARLKGEDGRINIGGLYEYDAGVGEREKAFWHQNEEHLRARLVEEMGVEKVFGENDQLLHERLGVRPTLEVHGIGGGFTGEGAKTVIPSEALAKVSLRLPGSVPPERGFDLLKKAVSDAMPAGYRFDVVHLHGGSGISISADNRYVQAAVQAIEHSYGKTPVYMREGGSIPIAALFDTILGLDVVLMGFGLPDDGPHGPNEKFSLDQFDRGIRTVARFLGKLHR